MPTWAGSLQRMRGCILRARRTWYVRRLANLQARLKRSDWLTGSAENHYLATDSHRPRLVLQLQRVEAVLRALDETLQQQDGRER